MERSPIEDRLRRVGVTLEEFEVLQRVEADKIARSRGASISEDGFSLSLTHNGNVMMEAEVDIFGFKIRVVSEIGIDRKGKLVQKKLKVKPGIPGAKRVAGGIIKKGLQEIEENW
ncbi:hypothetical protein ACFL25_01260 [Patescibacteria group bacterium]